MRYFTRLFYINNKYNHLQQIDSSLNYLYERIEHLDSEKDTIIKNIIDLSILLKRTKKKLELDETHHRKIIKDNDFYEITRIIRNVQKLSPQQMEYIRTLPIEKQTELLELYNECIGSIKTLFI